LDEIDNNFKAALKGEKTTETKTHIGGGVYAVVKGGNPYINLRAYFKPADKPVTPTRRGICLFHDEWEKEKRIIPQIQKLDPQLSNTLPCYEGSSHCNLMGALSCRECYPFNDEDFFD